VHEIGLVAVSIQASAVSLLIVDCGPWFVGSNPSDFDPFYSTKLKIILQM
jgi:hypothetical protein